MMDIYVLARIFKNPEFKYIVIYVGDSHAEAYRNILNRLGFQIRREYVNPSETKCVPIEPFKPFFSK